MIAAVYGFNTYGSTPTSKRAMYRATSECGTGPTRRTFGRAASARTFAITGPTKTKFRSGASSAAAASSARSISFRKVPTKPITRPTSRAKSDGGSISEAFASSNSRQRTPHGIISTRVVSRAAAACSSRDVVSTRSASAISASSGPRSFRERRRR